MFLLYYLALVVAKAVFFIFTRWEARGLENVPREGAFIVVSNHLSIADPVFLCFCLVGRPAFMAKESLFSPSPAGYLLRQLDAFPVRKGRMNRDALRQANEVLSRGRALIIFPEGMRSQHYRLKSAFSGAALIAVRNRVPILPIGIAGTESIKGLGWIWHRPRVTVNVGQSFYLPQVDGRIDKERLGEYTDSIMGCVAELLPHQYQGVYADTGSVNDTGD